MTSPTPTSSIAQTSKSQRSVKNLLIAPFRQISFGIYMIAISLVFSICALYMFYTAFWDQYQQIMTIFNVVDPKLQWEFMSNDVFYKNIIKIIAFLGLYLIVMFVTVFKLTHRYYGPMISIERFVEQLAQGHYKGKLIVRKNDDFAILVDKLNELAEKLDEKTSKP